MQAKYNLLKQVQVSTSHTKTCKDFSATSKTKWKYLNLNLRTTNQNLNNKMMKMSSIYQMANR